MFITQYKKEDNLYHCSAMEVIGDEVVNTTNIEGSVFEEVFAEAILLEENYYNYEFSDNELLLMAQSANLEMIFLLLSVEPSFTIIISIFFKVCSTSDFKHFSIYFSTLYTGTITLIIFFSFHLDAI